MLEVLLIVLSIGSICLIELFHYNPPPLFGIYQRKNGFYYLKVAVMYVLLSLRKVIIWVKSENNTFIAVYFSKVWVTYNFSLRKKTRIRKKSSFRRLISHKSFQFIQRWVPMGSNFKWGGQWSIILWNLNFCEVKSKKSNQSRSGFV